MLVREASEFYSIPSSNIQDWKIGKTNVKNIGHKTFLIELEELALVD